MTYDEAVAELGRYAEEDAFGRLHLSGLGAHVTYDPDEGRCQLVSDDDGLSWRTLELGRHACGALPRFVTAAPRERTAIMRTPEELVPDRLAALPPVLPPEIDERSTRWADLMRFAAREGLETFLGFRLTFGDGWMQVHHRDTGAGGIVELDGRLLRYWVSLLSAAEAERGDDRLLRVFATSPTSAGDFHAGTHYQALVDAVLPNVLGIDESSSLRRMHETVMLAVELKAAGRRREPATDAKDLATITGAFDGGASRDERSFEFGTCGLVLRDGPYAGLLVGHGVWRVAGKLGWRRLAMWGGEEARVASAFELADRIAPESPALAPVRRHLDSLLDLVRFGQIEAAVKAHRELAALARLLDVHDTPATPGSAARDHFKIAELIARAQRGR